MSEVTPEYIAAFFWLCQEVRAFHACDGETHAKGKVVAYCHAPTVVIETEDGELISWRADLCEVVEVAKS